MSYRNHNENFPKDLTVEMLAGFVTTERGCTHPRVGMIDGRRYIAKCGSWSAYSCDAHVHNECVADEALRVAGFHVPDSREYKVDFADGRGPQVVRLAVYHDAFRPLMQAWGQADGALRRRIRRQVIAAYPVQAFFAGIDTFTWDNVKIDGDGWLWFVDNGASFDFRACGKKKGWFWCRVDANDPAAGYLSLARHPNQIDLQEILGPVTDDELWAAVSNFDYGKVYASLPKAYQRSPLLAYGMLVGVEAGGGVPE